MTNRVPETARTRIRRLGSLTGAIAAVVTLGSSAATAATPVAADRSGLIIDGAVTHRSHLTVRELTRLPQQTVTLTFQGGSGAQTHTYSGPLLLDVLNQARPRFDPQVKADSLRHVITATGSDQHQAALAWAEIDPEFAGKAVLVALTEDGKPAADGRPRVVVPGDKRGGRYVASLVRLHLSASSRR